MGVRSCFLNEAEASIQNRQMSFALFDKGVSSQEIQKLKQAGVTEKSTQEDARLFKESEHRMNIVRQIQSWNAYLDEEVKKQWKEFTQKK